MPRKGTVLSASAKGKNDRAIKRWKTEHYENLSIGLRNGKRDAYKKLAETRGTSVSAMIQNYLDDECRKAGIELPETAKTNREETHNE